MTFRDQLEKLEACQESLDWVGNKSLKEAWEKCENPEWMIWFLSQTDIDLVDPVCDMAERVLDLVPEDNQLACIWAISAAKRRAKLDELDAAYDAADAAAAHYSTCCAYYANAYYASRAAASAADSSRVFANKVAYYAAAATIDFDDYIKENRHQCDILRKYFTIDQVEEAFNKLLRLTNLMGPRL
jgi:hypothetical protein